ncbi:MAG: hypothetical protein KDD25_01470 [Bdellovibrionales bacterium]|nr:hypothetical protein [Bdellovibrionales bacterium]
MSRGIFFGGAQSLDNDLVRKCVIRIPEVTIRLREAQKIMDQSEEYVDLMSLMNSENRDFQNFLKYRGALAAAVQTGLYDRYRKTQAEPAIFLGHANGKFAAGQCCGAESFEAMILESIKPSTPSAPVIQGLEMPILSRGATNARVHSFEVSDGEGFCESPQECYDVVSMIEKLADEKGLTQLIIIGPGLDAIGELIDHPVRERVQMLETIEMDPLLGWFWSDIKRLEAVPA